MGITDPARRKNARTASGDSGGGGGSGSDGGGGGGGDDFADADIGTRSNGYATDASYNGPTIAGAGECELVQDVLNDDLIAQVKEKITRKRCGEGDVSGVPTFR